MPQRVRIADRFKTQSAEQLVTMAGAVIIGLTNNPDFPAPTAFKPRRPLRPQRSLFLRSLCGLRGLFLKLAEFLNRLVSVVK
jgi:hypothetical protein